MRASSSSVIGGDDDDNDDDRIDEKKGCWTIIFVGVSNSMSTGFDFDDVNNDVDDGKSELEPSPVAESGKLLVYCRERKKKSIIYLIKLVFQIMQLGLKRNRTYERRN
jgi:hypothetical protein